MTTPRDDLFVDLAAARIGGKVLSVNDEFFAEKENLIADAEPVWDSTRFTDRGKWMDGWETRRRREPGHDWAIIRLGIPGIIHRVVVDTAHFSGNYPESCALEVATVAGDPPAGTIDSWAEVVPTTLLQGNTQIDVPLSLPAAATHVRFIIHPDGGVARLRVMGDPIPPVLDGSSVDLAALSNGGRAVDCSNRHYSSPNRMLVDGPALGMWDGWETRRRRGPGNDWAVIRLAGRGTIERLEVDTTHFKGNAPGWSAVFGIDAPGIEVPQPDHPGWQALLEQTPLSPDTVHTFDATSEPITHLRLDIFPDGGVARFRAWGRSTEPWTSAS